VPDFELLLACMLIVGCGLYWMMWMAIAEMAEDLDEKLCDQCGKPTGITWTTDAYYCSYECGAYAGDFSVRDGWKVNKEHLSSNAE
jgi:hypothetical protein